MKKRVFATFVDNFAATHSNGYIKRQIFPFYKSRYGKFSLEIKLFIKQSTHNTERSYLSHQAISNIS